MQRVRDLRRDRPTGPKRRSIAKAVTAVTKGKAPGPGSTREGSTPGAPGVQGASPADLAGSTRARSATSGTPATRSPGAAHAARVPAVEVTGAQSLVMALEALGVDTVFGIPGGAILPAYDPLLDSTKVRHILVRHEQGAGHAAEGYASVSGKVGVCMATSGPGATNLVTPIADAYMDSVPIVAITGQVTSRSIGTDAFQEADIRGITMPITKHNYLITDASAIPRAIAEAFHIAATGRPGPVLVDISKDALQAQTTFVWPPKLDLPGYRPVAKPHGKQIREAARLIRRRDVRCCMSVAGSSAPVPARC